MIEEKIFDFLETAYLKYNSQDFIDNDPIQIPHSFSKKQDIELAGFFAASLAWGQRKTIISKSLDLLNRMDNKPYEFITKSTESDVKQLLGFKHRTFNELDLLLFVDFFKKIYTQNNSLEDFLFQNTTDVETALTMFKNEFVAHENYLSRTGKHLSSPKQGSACKRLNMYFRWMVRTEGVDLGIWKKTTPANLICPLDVHVIRVANKLNLINTDKGDWKTAMSLTQRLISFDPIDPIKYDIALFGLGSSGEL